MRAAALALLLAVLPTVARAELGRDDQWSFVPATTEHGARAELRGDEPEGVPTQLIFQIECAARARVLIFRYDASEFGLPEAALSQRIALILNHFDGPDYSMPTSHTGARMEGRLALTADIAANIRDATYFEIAAPNDSGDAWQGGRAPALRQLAATCWGAVA